MFTKKITLYRSQYTTGDPIYSAQWYIHMKQSSYIAYHNYVHVCGGLARARRYLTLLKKTVKFVSKNTWTINIPVRAANYIDQVYARCTRSAPSWYTYFLTFRSRDPNAVIPPCDVIPSYKVVLDPSGLCIPLLSATWYGLLQVC